MKRSPLDSSIRWLPFRNDYSGIIPRNAILRVTGAATVNGQAVITVDRPSTTFSRIYAINSAGPVPNGGLGLCTFDAAYTTYDSGTPAFGESWGPAPNQWTLSKWYGGGTVIGDVVASSKLVLFKPEPINFIFGKLDGTLAVGSTADISIWFDSSTDSTMNLNGKDWVMKTGATSIASGKKVFAHWANGIWWVTNAECA